MMEQLKVEGERLRPFSCSQCQRKYRYRCQLRRHLVRRDHQQKSPSNEKREVMEPLCSEDVSQDVEKLEAEIIKSFDKLNAIRQKQNQIDQLNKDIKYLVKLISD